MLCPECGSPDVKVKGWHSRDANRRRYKCLDCGAHPVHLRPVQQLPNPAGPDLRRDRRKHRILVITAAQNATPPHYGFLRALRAYCERRGAELVVVPYRYKNPTSPHSKIWKEHEWWAPEIADELVSEDVDVTPHVMLAGDVHPQATAVNPLRGLDGYGGTRSLVVGHPRLELQSVPTPPTDQPKLVMTTGAVTSADASADGSGAYSTTLQGKRARHHHVYGAVIIETDGQAFHQRHVNAGADGAFTDLHERFHPDGSWSPAPPPDALVAGDLHTRQADPVALDAMFRRRDSVARELRPRRFVLHDSLDQKFANHHDARNPWERDRVRRLGWDDGRAEIQETLATHGELIKPVADTLEEVVYVWSNHDQALSYWMQWSDPRTDDANRWLYHALWYHCLPGPDSEEVEARPPYEVCADWWHPYRDRCRFLRPGDSYTLHGIELAYHGHAGPNGAKGTHENLSRIGVKAVIGDKHRDRIVGGLIGVGILANRDRVYNRGTPSAETQSSAIVHADGKRQLLRVVQGRWRGPYWTLPRRRRPGRAAAAA